MKQKTKAIFWRIGKDGERFFKEHKELEKAGVEVSLKGHVLDIRHLPTEEESKTEIIGVYVDSALTEKVLVKFSNLKMIVTFSTGFDHIDLRYCKKKNILVSCVPAYGEHTVAEYAFALILMLTKKMYPAYICVKEPDIRRSENIQGCDVKGKVLGVVGTGKIGKNVVKIGKGFDMQVIAYDVYEDLEYAKQYEFKYHSLEEVLSMSDIVTVHVPYLKETHHLLNKKNLSLMKESAYFINTSRGAVVETEGLYEVLQKGKIAGAGLDVLEEEASIFRNDESALIDNKKINQEEQLRRILIANKLVELPNVIITPHNASNTCEAHNRIFETSAKNVVSYLQGKPENLVPLP